MTKKLFRNFILILLAAFLFVGLYFLARQNYLVFHVLVELTGIVIGVNIFIITVNTYKYTKNDFFFFLSLSYFGISIIQLIHTLTYKGMGIFQIESANLPTQLWIAGRYMLAMALILTPVLASYKISRRFFFLINIVFAYLIIALLTTILYLKIFPACYIPGLGLTNFKIYSEYIISVALFIPLIILRVRKQKISDDFYRYFSLIIVFTILSELSFTRYVDVYGFYNMLGHLLMLLSVYFIYKILIEKTLREPIAILFKDLNEAHKKMTLLATTDGLTGLLNRKHALERIKEQLDISKRFKHNFSIIMIDLDNFKEINDNFGHLVGDYVLREFAKVLKKSMRDIDIIGRYGGDEFIVCPIEASDRESELAIRHIVSNVKKMKLKLKSQQKISLRFSVGIKQYDHEKNYFSIIEQADNALLLSKKKGKGIVTAR